MLDRLRGAAQALFASIGGPSAEKGYSGTPIADGRQMGSEKDHVLAWQTPQRWGTIQRMLTDSDVAAALNALCLPILSAPFKVEPSSDEPRAREIAEIMDADFNNMTTSLQQHRREVLDVVAWGNRIFEPVYERRKEGGNLWHLRKLGLRPSDTIRYWHMDDNGGPKGFTQADNNGKEIELSMDDVVAFTYGQVAGDLQGQSVLRAAYGPWMIKSELIKIGAAAIDRHGMGIPWVLYRGNNQTVYQKFQTMLQRLRSHSQSYALFTDLESPADWGIKGVEGGTMDPLAQIEYHRRAIYQAMGAQFLLLGSENVGSLALSEDQSSFFLMTLGALAQQIEDTYNRFLIPRWAGYNWPGLKQDELPRVKHGTIARRSASDWLASYKAALDAGLQLNQEAANETAHDLLRLPRPEKPSPAVDATGGYDVNAGTPEAEGQGGE